MNYIKTIWGKFRAYMATRCLLVENWRRVLVRSYTVWFAVFSALFGGVEYWRDDVLALLPIASPFLPDGVSGAVATMLTAAIPIARIVKQVKLEVAKAQQETTQ